MITFDGEFFWIGRLKFTLEEMGKMPRAQIESLERTQRRFREMQRYKEDVMAATMYGSYGSVGGSYGTSGTITSTTTDIYGNNFIQSQLQGMGGVISELPKLAQKMSAIDSLRKETEDFCKGALDV